MKDGFDYLRKTQISKDKIKNSYNNPEILEERIDGIIDILDDFFSTEPNFDS